MQKDLPKNPGKKRALKAGLIVVGLLLLLELPQLFGETTSFTSSYANWIFGGNFHSVVQNKLYRSGQMSHEKLAETIKEYGIKTVIDLRYGEDDPVDGVTEKDIVERDGGKYVHVPVLGSKLPDKATVLKLLDTYEQTEKPILVHCSSGTHRSGVASALYLLDMEKVKIETAKEQMDPKYGFFRLERALVSFFKDRPTIDNLLWQYEEDYNKSGIGVREWVEKNLK